MQVAQADMATHRMGQHHERLRQAQLLDPGEDRVEVGQIVLDLDDMAPMAMGEEAIRAALAAPVEDGDREAPALERRQRLAVLLDELGAARQDDHGALAARGGRRQVAQPDPHAVDHDLL